MTPGQWRVLVLLAVLAGVELTMTSSGKDFVKAVQADPRTAIGSANVAIVGWSVTGLILLIIAAWQPNLATLAVVVLLVMALIKNGNGVVTLTQGAIRAVTPGA